MQKKTENRTNVKTFSPEVFNFYIVLILIQINTGISCFLKKPENKPFKLFNLLVLHSYQ